MARPEASIHVIKSKGLMGTYLPCKAQAECMTSTVGSVASTWSRTLLPEETSLVDHDRSGF